MKRVAKMTFFWNRGVCVMSKPAKKRVPIAKIYFIISFSFETKLN
jgi:hypothetical protein